MIVFIFKVNTLKELLPALKGYQQHEFLSSSYLSSWNMYLFPFYVHHQIASMLFIQSFMTNQK